MKTACGMLLVATLGLVGCGTKAADCDTFMRVANANVERMKKTDTKDPKVLAAVVTSSADNARAVHIKDEGLAALTKEYVAVWDKGSAAVKNLESTDPNVIKAAIADLDVIEKEDSAAVDKINAYCR